MANSKINRIIIISLLLCMAFFYIPNKNIVYCSSDFNREIEVLSFNSLLAYPDIALSLDNPQNKEFDENHCTPSEFTKILNELYTNDYVLVSTTDLYEFKHNVAFKKNITLPKNKKPIIFIFNNLSYDKKSKNSGLIDKIIIDRYNKLASYTSKKSINERICYDNELIPILEEFIASYPDFSINSARAIITVTNENGLFGYKTSKSNATSRYDIKHAIEIASKLRSLGYTFSAGDLAKNVTSDIDFAQEITNWNSHTTKITKQTNYYMCNSLPSSDYQRQLILDNGFSVIISNSEDAGYYTDSQFTFINYHDINGKTLRENDYLSRFFAPSIVYDNINRSLPIINE